MINVRWRGIGRSVGQAFGQILVSRWSKIGLLAISKMEQRVEKPLWELCVATCLYQTPTYSYVGTNEQKMFKQRIGRRVGYNWILYIGIVPSNCRKNGMKIYWFPTQVWLYQYILVVGCRLGYIISYVGAKVVKMFKQRIGCRVGYN